MGVDRHEASRRGPGKKSGAANRAARRTSPKKQTPKSKDILPDPARTDWAKVGAGAVVAEIDGPPRLTTDAAPPAAAPGAVVVVPPASARAAKLARSDSVDVRIPRAWLEEISAITGEPASPHVPCLRSGIVLLRNLSKRQ